MAEEKRLRERNWIMKSMVPCSNDKAFTFASCWARVHARLGAGPSTWETWSRSVARGAAPTQSVTWQMPVQAYARHVSPITASTALSSNPEKKSPASSRYPQPDNSPSLVG
ncbi:hypothetical protein CRG98_048259 [Punica granatum]|uniref:Uncharacterized protein n=1 Tax=Punica granatum TaxID=22663 RepID=A0A2I0HI90_PUNGR|nr:hypothetical protein CRG98_048259 [Punica granatum]